MMEMYTELEANSAWQNGCRWVLESDSDYEVLDNRHDKGYKYILSIKRIFIQLLRSFVEQGWVSRLDEGNIERIDKSFILQDFKGKEADIVYKVRFGDSEVLFYILLELQSTVDHRMPYRLLLYMVEIWRNIIRDTERNAAARKDFRLPVIVPCVLYNGDDNWTVCRSFRETLEANELFCEYALDFKYILFDVKRYNKKKLLELANVIGAVFFYRPEAAA
ncbi:MAG: Rpn family recombination-promoting nuclease/putative transposase [Ruminiclostridium sp.]|nr:Rpn family recombination-promoting nuclease/putative transposase [Ruminiclostridium sp.]